MRRKNDMDEEVAAFVGLCLATLERYPVTRIAQAAKLSESTIYRLRNGGARSTMRFSTVQQLGIAARMKLEFHKQRARVRLVG